MRHVHLFDGNRLIATVHATAKTPQRHYVVNGQAYQAISYMEVTEKTGEIGYDVQVAALASPSRPRGDVPRSLMEAAAGSVRTRVTAAVRLETPSRS